MEAFAKLANFVPMDFALKTAKILMIVTAVKLAFLELASQNV